MKAVVHIVLVALVTSLVACTDETPRETQIADAAQPSSPATPAAKESPMTTTSQPARPVRSGPTDAEIRERMQRPEDTKVAEFAGLRTPKPVTWLWQPPMNRFRTANYTVPGIDGGDSAELVVTAFTEGDGGPIQGNIDRWISQFQTPEGTPVQPILEKIDVSGFPITLVELAGEWRAMGSPSFAKDQLFLGAIIERPEGNIFIRLAGDTPTVEGNRERFREFIKKIEIVSGDDAAE